MGLDIVAYTRLHKGECPPWASADEIKLRENIDFPGRFDGLDPTAKYFASEWNKFHFRAGSYSGYNEWRHQLKLMIGCPKEGWPTSGSFWELINFADNEGTIGPLAAQRLYEDFVKCLPQAVEHSKKLEGNEGDAVVSDDGEWFLVCYLRWLIAFEMARHDGAVAFH